MDKKKYFLILYLLSFGYLKNAFTSSIFNSDVTFVLTMFWGYWGWIRYRGANPKLIKTREVSYIVSILIFCFFVSAYIPKLYFNQPYISTLIAQRFNYVIILLLVVARIRPSESELMQPMRICSFITLTFFVISIFNPSFFFDQEITEKILLSRYNEKTTDIGTEVPGIYLTAFYLFYKLSIVWDSFSKKDLIECLVFLGLFIAYQNRSTLIGLLPLVVTVIYKFVKVKKTKAIFVIILIGVLSAPFLLFVFQSLSQETEEQMGMENYPRFLAINYFVIEAKDTFLKIVFGNGVWTETSDYRKLVESWSTKIFVSDIGILGTYFYYGLLPLIILYRYVFYVLFKRRIPNYLRFYSLWILIFPTIHTFLNNGITGNILFVLYFYLVLYYKNNLHTIYINH